MLRCMKLIASVIQTRCDEAELDPFFKPPPACPLQNDRINTRGESAVKPDAEPDKNVGGGKGETGARTETPRLHLNGRVLHRKRLQPL